MSDLRSKMIAKVRALMAKTAERGCTEAEALAAMQKARELMDAHELSSADLEEKPEGMKRGVCGRPVAPFDVREPLAYSVQVYCDCIGGIHHRRDGTVGDVAFFGHETDVMFATWLLAMLNETCNREADAQYGRGENRADWKTKQKAAKLSFDTSDLFGGANTDHLRNSFRQGFVDRVNVRLGELIKARQHQRRSDGTSLVVHRMAIVQRQWDALGIKQGEGRAVPRYAGDPLAYLQGSAAGDRAQFGRPVTGAGQLAIAAT